MSVKATYVVRVWNSFGKQLETVESSLRACIALVWGLKCEWEVVKVTATGWEFVGSDRYEGKQFAKQWNHNRRAFKCTLVKAAIALFNDPNPASITPWLLLCKQDMEVAWVADREALA